MKTDGWIEYWRSSLADTNRVNRHRFARLDDGKYDKLSGSENKNFKREFYQSDSPQLPKDTAEKLFKAADTKANSIPIAISAISLLPDIQHGLNRNRPEKLLPFWIFARIDKKGNVYPEDRPPVFVREVLAPVSGQHQTMTIAHVDDVDRGLEEIDLEYDGWSDYLEVANEFFELVMGDRLDKFDPDEYRLKREFTILLDEDKSHMNEGILELYQDLLERSNCPDLFETISILDHQESNDRLNVEEYMDFADRHVGQMTDGFALSPSQRRSLYNYLELEKGDVLAVNGPPGTGKTTLLQGIVANSVVESALEGKEPNLILASSANNQAITNIRESFEDELQSDRKGLLFERWIPEITSLGTYLKAQNEDPGDLPYCETGQGFPGFFDRLETESFLKTAKRHFLSKARAFFGESFSDASEVAGRCRRRIQHHRDRITEAGDAWKSFRESRNLIRDYAGETGTLDLRDEVAIKQWIRDQKTKLKELRSTVNQDISNDSFLKWLFTRTFSFLETKRVRELKHHFQQASLMPEEFFKEIETMQGFFDEQNTLLDEIENLVDRWSEAKENLDVENSPPLSEETLRDRDREKDGNPVKANHFHDELDVNQRHKMFWLAIHYWEARWIQKLDKIHQIVNSSENDFSSIKDYLSTNRNYRELWKLRAMLTPCYVSTFYMAPKFFRLYPGKRDGEWIKKPLYEFIDTLIVDEAGQVPPEVGAASFALAEKSIVVGDTKQLEPVANIPEIIDRANLKATEILSDETDQAYLGKLEDKGFLASTGNIMRLAKNATSADDGKGTSSGVLLTEHRRCFDEIILYCDEMAYGGELDPRVGSAEDKETLLSPMKFEQVKSECQSVNGSRKNRAEAEYISKWVKTHRRKIENYFNEKYDDQKSIEDLVGIVTPFAAQKSEFYYRLPNSLDLGKMTVGTIHALQGAEREIVIFSPTYGASYKGSYFFNDGGNMLNVAVSRAKETFAVFGNREVFQRSDHRSPVGILGKYLGIN